MRFGIYHRKQKVGTVTGTDADYRVESDDPGVERAVNAVMRERAGRMTGMYKDGVCQDWVEEYAVGDPGHMEAALCGGALIMHGYAGRRED